MAGLAERKGIKNTLVTEVEIAFAETLGLSLRSGERLWTFNRAWLRDALRRTA